MTPKQKSELIAIADGGDIAMGRMLAEAAGKRASHQYATTIMALLRKGYLQFAHGRGIEISEAGKAAAEKLKRKAGQ